jgi:hypothetical protein
MLEIIRDFLDLHDTPTWGQVIKDFTGAAAVFLVPLFFALWLAAFGWSH